MERGQTRCGFGQLCTGLLDCALVKSLRVSGISLVLLMLIVGIDQLTKWLVVENLDPQRSYPVIGEWFRLFLIRNPGAAFSFGVDSTIFFSIFQIIASIICVVTLLRVRTCWAAAPAVLIGAGAMGNLLDRIFRSPGGLHGHVVDFFSFGTFAIFNVADAAITVGVVVYLWFVVVVESKRNREEEQEEAALEAEGAAK